MYLFPRDCPRVLFWPLAETTRQDLDDHWRGRTCRMVAVVERGWLDRIEGARLFRYALPDDAFESLGDAGMWISRTAVSPLGVEVIADVPGALRALDIELQVVDRLTPLRHLWSTTLHVSGIRLRNAQDWA